MGLIQPRVGFYILVISLLQLSCEGSQKNGQRTAQQVESDRAAESIPADASVIIVQNEIIPHESLLLATGAQLYKIHCELCHGSLAELDNNANDPMTFTLLGKNSLAIQAAMERIPEMRPLLDKGLSDNSLDLIAAELNKGPLAARPTEPEPLPLSAVGDAYQPQMPSGLQMYKKYCGDASCHGSAETSSINAKTFPAFIGALNSIPVMKNRADLQGLTRSHLEAILKSL